MTPRPPSPAGSPVLTVVVPVKDEEESIGPFVARVGAILSAVLPDARAEILFVDDGSTDATLAAIERERAADGRVRAVSLSRNFGKEAALSAGLDHARGAAVIPLDVDLQDPPELIGAMLERWREGYDVVYGVRRARTSDSAAKRLTAHWFYKIHNSMTRYKIPEHAGDFRLLDRRVVDVIRALPERNRFMKGLFNWAGFTQIAIEYDRSARTEGHTKFRPWQLWSLAVDGITSATTMPLRIWSYLGAGIAALSLIYAAYVIVRTLLGGVDVPGYASLLVAVLFLGGVQLLSLGILGEYVGRIFTEVKGRPIYIVERRLGEDED